MILVSLALQAAAALPAPNLEGAAWHYVGRSDQVAHYADADSVLRDGPRRAIVARLISFAPGGDDKVVRYFVDCTERFAGTMESYDAVSGRLQPRERGLLDGVRMPANIYPMIRATIDLACDGRAGVPVADPVQDANARGREASAE